MVEMVVLVAAAEVAEAGLTVALTVAVETPAQVAMAPYLYTIKRGK
jgi:hypothetical protein